MKWLKELEEEKRQLQGKKEAEEKETMEQMRSFVKHDAKKHMIEKTTNDDSESASRQPDAIRKGQTALNSSNPSSFVLPNASGTKKTKPAWCQSEITQEESELDAETNLLSFVDGLDFDQYAQDLELQAIIGQLKERIKTLERENKKDQNKLQICLDVSSSSCVESDHENVWWMSNFFI